MSAVGTTLTNGIQDISALLPLLGSEQCEKHAGSVLRKGYIYAAATPLSLFGTLGIARVALKTLAASISSKRISGASLLADAGFQPSGENVELIMYDNNKENLFVAETRLNAILEDRQSFFDDTMMVSVNVQCRSWNRQMILCTAAFSLLGLTPYVYLGLHGGSSLPAYQRLLWPATRVLGGFLSCVGIQIAVQHRLLVISRLYLLSVAVNRALKGANIKFDSKVKTQIRQVKTRLTIGRKNSQSLYAGS